MSSIGVLNECDARRMVELGYKHLGTTKDVNDQDVYIFELKDTVTFSKDNLPQSAFLIERFCMNF